MNKKAEQIIHSSFVHSFIEKNGVIGVVKPPACATIRESPHALIKREQINKLCDLGFSRPGQKISDCLWRPQMALIHLVYVFWKFLWQFSCSRQKRELFITDDSDVH